MSTPATELGFSYEYAVDVNLGTPEAPNWQAVRFSSAIDPQVTPVTQDGATYDNDGSPNPIKLSESWTLGLTIQAHRLPSGAYLPEVEKLLSLSGPEAVGNGAVGHVRWYDDPVAPSVPNPNEAFEGFGTITVTRQNTGNDQIGGWSVTITGQGRRKRITNPASENLPELVSIAVTGPATVADGATVTLVATATYDDTSTAVVTGLATWASDDDAVATVAAGVVTGVGAGDANITAAIGAVTSPAHTVTVTA